jgi:hypothetical protein
MRQFAVPSWVDFATLSLRYFASLIPFLILTALIFLAIVCGIAGIVLEGRRIAPGSGAHNPATRDTPLSDRQFGQSVRALSRDRTGRRAEFDPARTWLGTLVELAFYYALLSPRD